LTYPYTDNELLQLLRYDDDAFNRWEAGQRLALTRILDIAKLKTQQPSHESSDLKLDQAFIAAIANLIQDTSLSPAFRAQLATLPSEAYIAQHLLPIDPQAIHFAREFVRTALAKSLEKIWANLYESNQTTGTYRPDADSMGKRALKNLALAMLAETHNEQWHHLAFEQFTQANNMTDRFSALSTLVYSQAPQAQQALDHFYDRYQHHALAIDKWFRLQALCKPQTESRSIVERVSNLTTHPDFTLHNPNRARSVIHSFCLANQAGFHLADGRGYQFWKTNVIALDTINPQIAATLARALDRWKAFAQPWQGAMQEALHQVASEQLSKNTREVIDKALAETI
jgi:aminopeptidase N